MAPPGQRVRARHEEAVFRYALGVLGDPREADAVVAAAVDLCRSASRGRLIDVAHALCAQLVEAEAGPDELAAEEQAGAAPIDPRDACAVAEHALSRALDGRLDAAGRAALEAHLEACEACARIAVVYPAQRTAVRAALRIALRHRASSGSPRLLGR
jgi:putative zinc finger protein